VERDRSADINLIAVSECLAVAGTQAAPLLSRQRDRRHVFVASLSAATTGSNDPAGFRWLE